MIDEVIVVDFFKEIAAAMIVSDVLQTGQFLSINYEPGKDTQIINSLLKLDYTEDMKGLKYPLMAVKYPVEEIKTTPFATVRIPFMLFAYLTKTGEGTEDVKEKYSSDGIFKTVLYPCYREFLKRLARSTSTNIGDPFMFPHTKIDNPSDVLISKEVTDHVDIIEIHNLEITFNQIKTC